MTITVGVLALQGAFLEHLVLLKRAAQYLNSQGVGGVFEFTEVRNVDQLGRCDALIIPGGESTTISLVAAQSGLLEPLRDFVKYAAPPPPPPPPSMALVD
jgi:5'-phosphate synthase pdxT subunit